LNNKGGNHCKIKTLS